MTEKAVAEILIETLIAAGVMRIYGVVGDSLNGILEEMRRSKKIEWIGVRHEETAAFAAGAQAHLTGELAVCLRRRFRARRSVATTFRKPIPTSFFAIVAITAN